MTKKPRPENIQRWIDTRPLAYLRQCAEGEGGRAKLAIGSSENAAAYYAREAFTYAAAILKRRNRHV